MLIALIIVGALIAALLVNAATRPPNFSVQRSLAVKAPPASIYPFIADLRQWEAWSPFEKLDPGMKRLHSGAAAGGGAIYEWDGNGRAGAGRMEIIEATPPSRLVIELHFKRPIAGHNIAEFTLDQRGDGTSVTWGMRGPTAFIAKVMSPFFSMDKVIGIEFESGLAALRGLAEA